MFWAKHTFLLNSQGFAQLEHTFRCTWQRQTNPTCPPKIASITLSLSLATISVISHGSLNVENQPVSFWVGLNALDKLFKLRTAHCFLPELL